MRKLLRKLWKDRRGNALVIVGAALPVTVAAAGLATDTIQWALWKRELQRAADSGAFAGVYAKLQDNASKTARQAVEDDVAASKNNHTGISLQTGYPQVTYPTSVNFSYGVKVTLAIQKHLGFSSLFMPTSPIIVASATAALIDAGDYCVVALEKTTATGIAINGNTNTNLGCGAISNSTSRNAAVTGNGSYNFQADPVAAVGGLPSSITGVTTLRPHHTAMPDPFANQYSTSVPPGTSCRNFSQNAYTTTTGTGQNRVTTSHLSAGCYSSFSPNGSSTYYMDPGVYYLDRADFNLNGSDTLIGTGVTIILTGSSPGGIKVNGTSTVQLSAPTSGAYMNMLFIQSENASKNNGNTINGTSNSKYDGAMYLPKGQVSFAGSAGDTTKCVMVVANQVVFTGNSNLQNNTTGCTSAIKKKGKEVRLVA